MKRWYHMSEMRIKSVKSSIIAHIKREWQNAFDRIISVRGDNNMISQVRIGITKGIKVIIWYNIISEARNENVKISQLDVKMYQKVIDMT